MELTAQKLADLMQCPISRAEPFIDSCNQALSRFFINTNLRVAHFCSQVGHETGGLKDMEERWGPTDAQKGYEGRVDLGNVLAGDGFKFRGRGWIQLTGRSNYQRASNELCADFMVNPGHASLPEFAPLLGALYWSWRRLNDYADKDDIQSVTLRINGGYNGIADRKARLANCKKVLGVS